MVMTNDMWLGPQIPQLKELADFDLRYWKQLQGPRRRRCRRSRWRRSSRCSRSSARRMERMQKDGDKLSGTPLETTTTFESVKSKDQLTQAQASSRSSSSSGGGLGGLLAKKIIKKEEPKARSTIFTTHHEVLEVSTSVAPRDLGDPGRLQREEVPVTRMDVVDR